MLIGVSGEPFDSPDHIFELKQDGERCLAYIDKKGVDLRNKRNMRMNPKVPELSNMYKRVKEKCILDGELLVYKDGQADFSEIQRRSLMSNKFKIELTAKQYPACFVAFDILYHKGSLTTDLPLMERKSLLQTVVEEDARIAVSRYIEMEGIRFFDLVEKKGLEGIVAKRKDSRYYFGKRTKDWIKIKNLIDDDFIICGYIPKEGGVNSLVLGQYAASGELVNKGHVTLGVSTEAMRVILKTRRQSDPPFVIKDSEQNAVWLEPQVVCTVKYMPDRYMRQPIFKGLRFDKRPEECVFQ